MLSIGFVASTLYAGLPSLVSRLRRHAPELDIQLLELLSTQQIPALKEGRVDLGFGRLRHGDPNVTSTVLHEERLVVAVPMTSRLADVSSALTLDELQGERLIVYPKEPRPSYADHVMTLLLNEGVVAGEVHEVRELQTALGLVAAEAGVCIIPSSARQMRSDVHYRAISTPRATSPIILSCRAGDSSPQLELVRRLIHEIYAESPPGD